MRLLITILGICVSQILWAQSGPPAKKIASIISSMPAEDHTQYEKQMEAIASLGEKGIEQMALMLGDDKNGQLQFALGGFSNYVVQPGEMPYQMITAKAYIRALAKTTDVSHKVFLINQLQIVGKDESVGHLLNYMNDPQLTDPVIRALVKINAVSSRRALMNSLYTSNGQVRTRLVAALGDIGLTEAAPVIGNMLPTADNTFREVALNALSRIGNPQSMDVFLREAKSVSFQYNTSAVTGNYLLYLKNLLGKGYRAEVDKAAWDIWTTAKQPGAVKARLAALSLLAGTRQGKIVPVLYNVMQEEDRVVRMYALDLGLQYLNDVHVNGWLALLKTSSVAAQEDIINMLGRSGNARVLPTLLQYTENKNTVLQLASIRAIKDLGRTEAQPRLLEMLNNADKTTTAAIFACLREMNASGVNMDQISAALEKAPHNVKLALIGFIGEKGAISQADVIVRLLESSDSDIRNAAYAALPGVSSETTLPVLYKLLHASNDTVYTAKLQKAIISGINSVYNPQARIDHVTRAYKQSPADKQYLYLEIFGQVGSKEALAVVTDLYKKGTSEEVKSAALKALQNWSNIQAAEPLYQMATTSTSVLHAYLSFVSKNKFTPAQRLLELRRAMEIAVNDKEKEQIISELGRCTTLPGLLYTGKFLDNAKFKNVAAKSVFQIVTGEKNNWNGPIVVGILEKALPGIQGTDAEYQRIALRNHIDGLSKVDGFTPLFNGIDLSGWKGLVSNPVKRAAMSAEELKVDQKKADSVMRKGWLVKEGILIFTGKGSNLCTEKQYGDFELYVDWKITAEGDAGIYLRGSPQVQIWDTSRVSVGAQVGSGGLYNNQKHLSKPLVVADNEIGSWNSFYIRMTGDMVTVYLNGVLVTDKVVMENYWNRLIPIFPKEQLELQAHGTYVAYRDLFLREINTKK